MLYQISRNGQMYGPYTMEDLQRYLASGHVLLTDMVKSEDMAEWIPVSQLLSTHDPATSAAPSAGYAPASYGQAMAPGTGVPYPDPPNLHWAVVLLLDLVTCSLFQMVWNIILSAWFRRVVPTSRALFLYIGSAALLLTQAILGQVAGIGRHGRIYGNVYDYSYSGHAGAYGLYGLVALVCWIVRLVARFTFRAELEQHYNTVEPIGLRINPVLTFFFGGIYLQSQMNRINAIKQAMRFR